MKKVLVVDDKDLSRELIRTILEQCGHLVCEASDGFDAVRSAREFRPDLIVLDLQMPLLDGYGVLRVLRADETFAAVPVVAVTASAMHGDREHALAAGFTGYLAKPVRVHALRSELERLLETSACLATSSC